MTPFQGAGAGQAIEVSQFSAVSRIGSLKILVCSYNH
jgi:hypothetical protein